MKSLVVKCVVVAVVLVAASVSSAEALDTRAPSNVQVRRQAFAPPFQSPFQAPFQQQPAFQAPSSFPQYQPYQQQPLWRILSQSRQFDPAGFYRYSFETENGIQVAEEGTVIRPGTNDESTAKQGSYSYPGPDGVVYTVSYVADENGYRPSGAHLPTPPPIPEAILKSLEQNAREERRGGFRK